MTLTSEALDNARAFSDDAWWHHPDRNCLPPEHFTEEQAAVHRSLWTDLNSRSFRLPEKLCRHCPVKRECLNSALEEEARMPLEHRHTIRGGTSPEQRAVLAGERGVA